MGERPEGESSQNCHTGVCLLLIKKTSEDLINSHIFLQYFNEWAYFTYQSIFHEALNLFQFDYEITRESIYGQTVPENQPVQMY